MNNQRRFVVSDPNNINNCIHVTEEELVAMFKNIPPLPMPKVAPMTHEEERRADFEQELWEARNEREEEE